jgi:hypothetical protein
MGNEESSNQATGIVSSISLAELRKVFRNWAVDNKLIQ